MLSRFPACLNETRPFLEMKGIEHPELAETEWLLMFYYLVDMTDHLYQPKVKMQGNGNAVLSRQQAMFHFENKLELFIMDLETGRLLHFEKLRQYTDACTLTVARMCTLIGNRTHWSCPGDLGIPTRAEP
ncbi:unnamed protein product [Dibothriocephalus latus]|uniref:Uncharacterized protein n=1 Tax=Dibothriocephalus latus TaxID=60516 RepID=A0A3P7L586_DIBLA|nr:unnamed protein product [Dibothriocephalus latus]